MNAAPLILAETPGLPRSGLLYLRNAVADYFDSNGVPAEVARVGLKFRSFQSDGNRIVFIPGDFDGDVKNKPRKYGSLSRRTRNAGSVVNPRELLSWERPITISIWAAPPAGMSSADEDESVGVVEDLLEELVRAVQEVARASVVWGEVIVSSPPVESAFGCELLVKAVQTGPLYGVSYDVVQASPGSPRGEVT